MDQERLIHMAHQIAKFFMHANPEQAAAEVADHMTKFWDPRMRQQIQAVVATRTGPDIDPVVRDAISRLP